MLLEQGSVNVVKSYCTGVFRKMLFLCIIACSVRCLSSPRKVVGQSWKEDAGSSDVLTFFSSDNNVLCGLSHNCQSWLTGMFVGLRTNRRWWLCSHYRPKCSALFLLSLFFKSDPFRTSCVDGSHSYLLATYFRLQCECSWIPKLPRIRRFNWNVSHLRTRIAA